MKIKIIEEIEFNRMLIRVLDIDGQDVRLIDNNYDRQYCMWNFTKFTEELMGFMMDGIKAVTTGQASLWRPE